MYGVAPMLATAAALLRLAYPLSAETSAMWKFCAVVSIIGGSNLESLVFRSRISTAVTMLVLTPHMRWHLTQSCCAMTLPYLWPYQRVNRDVVKPDESTAKSTSTDHPAVEALVICKERTMLDHMILTVSNVERSLA